VKEKERPQRIIRLLQEEYPDARTALSFHNPLELLVATILSAQSTDKQVNRVTMRLFKKYRTARDYARADLAELEGDVKSTGFYRRKAKYLKKTGEILVEMSNSEVPRTMEELMKLPGVARKTANIVLSNAFGVIEGLAVDTHVRRLSQRLALTKSSDPIKIEKDLMEIVPKSQWPKLTDLLIFHGRRVCSAKNPQCELCVINILCPSAFSFQEIKSGSKSGGKPH
jgi:endonuclease-3